MADKELNIECDIKQTITHFIRTTRAIAEVGLVFGVMMGMGPRFSRDIFVFTIFMLDLLLRSSFFFPWNAWTPSSGENLKGLK